MENSVEIKEFLGMEVRFINDEWIVLKDVFSALGRVKENGSWTDEKKKLSKIIGEENITKFKIKVQISNSLNKRSFSNQYVLCAKKCILEKYDIISLFKKGVVCTNYRNEHSFVSLVEDFFKHDVISLEKQFNILEYRVDISIGDRVFIEFDEEYHEKIIEQDIERMQKISLANTYWRGYLANTNDYKEQKYELEEYGDFNIYEFNGAYFIRVFNKSCLSWIPLMYYIYCEDMDGLLRKPTPYIGNSKDLINLKYSI
ncbi:MAG: hypothetical protein E6715_05740 [Clostridium perfringens]|nr:hypothetical protein [Clostridium perfringens]